jgi:glycosyltransferase involved in cell wall biosynthesis
MKILILSPYITIQNQKNFSKNITGFGLMVRDIANSISSKGVMVDVLTMSAITKGFKYNKVTIIRRTWLDILLSFKFYYLKKMIFLVSDYKLSIIQLPKIFYYYFSAGYIENVIKRGNYDLINIHGIGFSNQPFIECCKRLGCKFVITIHGLNSFSEFVKMEQNEKRYERNFLSYLNQKKIPLIVISSGIKKSIKKFLRLEEDPENIYVISNGTDLNPRFDSSFDIRKKYNIGNEIKIFLCVGNLSIRKNQEQLIRTFHLLTEEIKTQICILLIGIDKTNGEIYKQICGYQLDKKILNIGFVDRQEIHNYYSQADYTVLVSQSEGFGLSIIEGFTYGLPNLTYYDLDAVYDLYNENVMITLTDRSDQSLAEGIMFMVEKEWNREIIKKFVEKFSYNQMAINYLNVFEDIINEKPLML